ncbi:MAG: putative permease [Rhodobacteraceae bacterium HLUCCA12]|nr:MAG: putative permease [Rhodobacteraceae bacterium HLUCCA12]
MNGLTDIMAPVLTEFDTIQLAFLGAATIFGAVFRAYAGFGAGLFLVPIYSLFLSPSQAIVLVTLLNLPTTLQILPRVWHDIPWRRVAALNVMAAATIPIGVWLLVRVDGDALTRVIGVLVIALAVLLLSGWRYRGPQALPQDLVIGMAAGLISGATGMGGPPIVLYFLSGTAATVMVRAAFIVSFFFITVVTFASLVTAGLVALPDVLRFAVLLPAYAIGTWLGSALFQRTKDHDRLFRTVALCALMVVGVVAVAH